MARMIIYGLVIAAGLFPRLAEADAQCGKTFVTPSINLDQPKQRIVGGSEAVAHSYPWLVSLQSKGGGGSNIHFCGGSLIRVNDGDSTDIVLTASHCLVGGNVTTNTLLIGAHSKTAVAPGQLRVDAVYELKHPQWNSFYMLNDVGLIKLKTPVKFSQTIQPICLPEPAEELKANTRGAAAGWGLLKESSGDVPDKLQQALLPSMDDTACTSFYTKDFYRNEMFCAGYTDGKIDSCQSDSGGPYMTKRNNQYIISGIVSWGTGCARKNAPGVYAKVSNYIPWIKAESKRLSSLTK